MDLSSFITLAINFTQQWIGTTIPRILSAFFGTLICVLAAAGVWDRRLKTIVGALLFLTGAVLIVFALDPNLPYVFARASYLTRIRALMIFLSFVVVAITIEAIRRSHLQERYALLWVATGLIILLVAFFPRILEFFTITIGTSYLTSVVGIIFTFLLLIAFHFSIALSGYQKKQSRIAQRCAILEERIEELEKRLSTYRTEGGTPPAVFERGEPTARDSLESPESSKRRLRGSQVAAPLIIAVGVLCVLYVGLVTPQPMIGDEVTHYYMLQRQAQDLSQPNFLAKIPTGWGATETRSYPHAFLWHYLGAVVFKLTGGSFAAVQCYQTLFWAQFLFVAYLLAKSRGGIQTRSMIPYLFVLASLPLSLIFSVTFYQDVPVSAQVITAFYLLNRSRNTAATMFMCLAIGIKITALLFLPAFFGLMLWRNADRRPAWRSTMAVSASMAIILVFTWGLGRVIKANTHAGFYPEQKIHQLLRHFSRAGKSASHGTQALSRRGKKARRSAVLETEANRPGNLKLPENYLIYGGVVMWLILVLWAGSLFFPSARAKEDENRQPSAWLWVTGLSYILMAAYFLRSAPDARFFLPGIPFVLLPMCERIVRLPRSKVLISLIAALSILQGGYVLAKTFQLRQLSPGLAQAIAYLEKHPPEPARVFMYPEGNYRLFPVPHEWYFNYRLREFWKSDNDERLRMLRKYRIGAIVIKKHLIARAGENFVNLGIYPVRFVKQIRRDPRFKEVFENEAVVIFRVPYPEKRSRSTKTSAGNRPQT